MLSHLEKR
jgi:hypothetical protein